MQQARGVPDLLARIGPAILLCCYWISQYYAAWRLPFLNEDYAFLDTTRPLSVLELWTSTGLRVGPWYRPWSQGVHFWLCQTLFGMRMELWHAASLALAVGAGATYFAFIRRTAGWRAAGVASACTSALAAWGTLICWTAGVQDLWMLLFALVSLSAFAMGRVWLAAAALFGALLSKETAVILPALSMSWCLLVERQPLRLAFRRSLAMWGTLLLWLAFYQVLHTPLTPPLRGAGHDLAIPAAVAKSAILSAFNLDAIPHPSVGWLPAIGAAFFGAIPLLALCAWAVRRGLTQLVESTNVTQDASRPATGFDEARLVSFGFTWAVLGWLPILLPSLRWHAYYGLLGSLGAWLAISIPLARRPRLALAVILALLLLRAGRSTTVIHDWGEESYVRRAGVFVDAMRADLLAKVPSPKPHTRFYFTQLPSEVGFLIEDGPSLRVWYRDPTLRGDYWANFRARASTLPPGEDRFLRYDVVVGWVEVVPMLPPSKDSSLRSQWTDDHRRLAQTLARGEDWAAAFKEFRLLAEAEPESASYAFLAGLSALALADTMSARTWVARAAALPMADPEAQALNRLLQSGRVHKHVIGHAKFPTSGQ